MRAIAIDRFGGVDELKLRDVPKPTLDPDEVLIRVEAAGVGEWDPFEREGGYAEMLGTSPKFPYVLGSEGAGAVVDVGDRVSQFAPGDRVYAIGFLNPKGGFYAEYAAVKAELVAHIPTGLITEQAAVMGGAGLTALRGLSDVLKLRADEAIAILGASGGVGHIAVQLAKRLGARVLAVASGSDGISLVKTLGADAAVDGRSAAPGDDPAAFREGLLQAVADFAPEGIDAALLTAGGTAAEQLLSALRPDGRAAYPNGVELQVPDGKRVIPYNGEPDHDILDRFDELIDDGPFDVHLFRTFPLEQAAEAHRALAAHHLGKLALRIGAEPGGPSR
jgi:NADPH:quinone reductase-like Zn-dependent oxidoreductase